MTREDAIKRLEDTFEAWEGWIPHNDSPASKLSEALGMAIAALREQSRSEASNQQVTESLQRNGSGGSEPSLATKNQVKTGWISAKDRPPEEWKEKGGDLINYLVFMPEYGVDVGNYAKPVKTWLCMGIPCKVTHWMPMPEPPEVEV